MRREKSAENAIRPLVETGQLAGAAALVWRDGRIEEAAAVGRCDLISGLPVERDTIFRIASMTKPVTTVAALSMMDEGRFALDDPIADHAPEFSKMRVLRAPDGPLDQVDYAARPITFRDLLTHRSGVTYGDFHRGPIGHAYASALGPQIDNPLAPDDWIARLATLPLVDQPGAGFRYGHSTDLLGFLLARAEGAPLSAVLERRIFSPLGMRDTSFTVAPSKRGRCAGLCGFDSEGRLTPLTSVPAGHALAERPEGMTFEAGGQGLWSTLDDYLVFARMLISDGPRLLRPETLAMMTSNQLSPDQRAATRLLGQPIFASGHGYGMGVAVVLEPEHADPLRCKGGRGTIGWPGAYGGWWQADPSEGSVLIFLSHTMVELHQMARGIGLGAWSAIGRFHEAATA
jgi:CubicO group peptidase (beta-lactamase class C family)